MFLHSICSGAISSRACIALSNKAVSEWGPSKGSVVAKGNNSAISTSLSSFHASSSRTTPRRTPTSSQRRPTASASQPAKRTESVGPAVSDLVKLMGRSPKVARRFRSVRTAQRSFKARAKSRLSVSKTPSVPRVWPSKLRPVEVGNEADMAVMVGFRRNSRSAPLLQAAVDCWILRRA